MDCGLQCSSTKTVPLEHGHVDTKGLVTLISSKVPLVILDARQGKWDDGKRIATAQTLPEGATKEQIETLIPSKNSLVVVYCSNSQCPASNYLANQLTELGYLNILKYKEGIQEWINSGHPVRQA
ncbi:MAG: rhodanese-like domain-containing protein [Verrucomicrobia bacterium]|nr:rhodanese-like domain-containing protein [Verrucomicrobiota bacterium]